MKYFASAFALLLIISAVYAIEMNSSSFRVESATPTASGILTSESFVARSTLENIAGRVSSSSFIAILGFDFPLLAEVLNQSVTFVLEFSIQGAANDRAEVDTQTLGNTTTRIFGPGDITNFYVCMEDTAVSGTPTYGIVFSGKRLSYINLSVNTTQNASFRLQLSQAQEKNRFVLPITRDGCAVIRSKFQLIKIHGFLPQALVSFFQGKSPVELILSYPDVDIVGDFPKTGSGRLVLEKNEADTQVVIIVRE